jgi:hypothetical protein
MDVVEVWRKSNNQRCRCTRCFYCDEELDVHQHDHYPVPRRAAGTRVVAACHVCHELKDRIPLQCWDSKACDAAIHELFGSRFDDLRHFPIESAFEHCYLEIEAEWDKLSPIARLAYAKMRSVFEDGRYLDKLGL